MNSIKSRLILRILPCLGILWLLCSGALYYYTKNFLYQSLDNELNLVVNDAPFIVHNTPHPKMRRIQARVNLFSEGGSFFFQAWDKNKTIRRKSESLNERDISYPTDKEIQNKQIIDTTLSDGTKVRSMSRQLKRPKSRASEGLKRRREQERPELTVTISCDTSSVENTLGKLRWAIFISTIFGLIATTIAITLSIRQSLKPLNALGTKITHIGSKNLYERLDSSQDPEELQMVSSKINNLLERLNFAFERERRFGHDLAHEIRTPTAEILALSEVGLKWPEEFGKEELGTIFQSAQRMEHTTQALLDLARLSATTSIEYEDVDLTELVAEIFTEYQRSATQKDLTFSLSEETNVTLHTNLAFFSIILRNLIDNAVSYAPNGDTIQLTVDDESLSLSNTAPDLKTEDLESMFERFWRKDGARTST